MDSLLTDFPRALLVVDGALDVIDFSRRCAMVFGHSMAGHPKSVGDAGDWCTQLTEAVAAAPELGDELALATARLTRSGEEETSQWERGGRVYDVTVTRMEEEDRYLVLFSDVTHQKLTEEIQTNARHYLEHILGHIPLGVVVLNRDMRITSANPLMMEFLTQMGLERDLVAAIGAGLPDILPEQVGAEWETMCRTVLESGKATSEDRRAMATAAEEGLVLATEVTPLRDHRGQITGIILIADDVTEQTRLERELVRVEKLATVGEMAITVNHEINNPLTIIATTAQAIKLLNPDLDDKTKIKLERIEAQVRRISEVTERLRTLEEVVSSEYIADGPQMIDLSDGGTT